MSIKVIGASDAEGAAAVILRAFLLDTEVRRVLTEAGFEHHEDENTATGFVLRAQGQALSCPTATSTRDGLYQLSQALRYAIRADKRMKKRFASAGLVPLVQ